jgi:flagellar biosynthesis anti-sigma factor FlgM
MKIANTTPNYINQTYTNQANSQKTQKPTEKASSDSVVSDTINLSSKTKDLQKISKAMETEPAGRASYVADIKQRVENNQYEVNPEAIAEGIISTFA